MVQSAELQKKVKLAIKGDTELLNQIQCQSTVLNEMCDATGIKIL